jgi:hypothetical protein
MAQRARPKGAAGVAGVSGTVMSEVSAAPTVKVYLVLLEVKE